MAAAAAGIAIGDDHAGAIYNATGPERLSGAERAALIAEITGRPLAFRAITGKQLRAGLTQAGLPAAAQKATRITQHWKWRHIHKVEGEPERAEPRLNTKPIASEVNTRTTTP